MSVKPDVTQLTLLTMNFETPPPFAGAFEESLDLELDARMTVDDDEDVSTAELNIPPDLPCSSNSPSPLLSLGELKQKLSVEKANISAEKLPIQQECDSSLSNGITEDVGTLEDVQTASNFCLSTESGNSLANVNENQVLSEVCASEDDFGDDFGDFAGVEAEFLNASDRGPPHEMCLQNDGSSHSEMPEQSIASKVLSHAASREMVQSQEDWNAFSTVGVSDEDNGWSTDFAFVEEQPRQEVESQVLSATEGTISEASSSPDLDELCESVDLWNDDNVIGIDEAYNITESLDADILMKSWTGIESFDRCFDLWFALRVVENALALKFEWKSSKYGANFYKSLNVNPNAVRRGSLLPLSTSAVLEPTPLIANGTTRRSVIISREEGAYGAKVVAAAELSENILLPTTSPASVVESPSIPQADFDWEQSDLKNPTKAANRCSALLDVDFLSANSGGVNLTTVSTLQKELDQLGLTKSALDVTRCSESQPSVLDILMASATNTSKRNIRQPSELSLDARALHDQLPDIDFLRASMIMFPLGGGRSSSR